MFHPTFPAVNTQPNYTFSRDNAVVIRMINTGRRPNLRVVTRTHRVDLDWLFERSEFRSFHFGEMRVPTNDQVADFLDERECSPRCNGILC